MLHILRDIQLMQSGFSTQPPLTSHLVHLYVFLMLDDTCRSQKWSLAKRGSEVAYDWRSQDSVDDGDLEIRVNSEYSSCPLRLLQ
jgi:hypothetical protein